MSKGDVRGRIVRELLASGSSGLIVIYDSRRHPADYIRRFVDAISPAFRPRLALVPVDIANCGGCHEELRSVLGVEGFEEPILAFIHNRRVLWLQYGLFGDIEVDKEALRLGIWATLERWGLTPRRLGIRFDLIRG